MAYRFFRRFFPNQPPTQIDTVPHQDQPSQPKPEHDVTVTDQQQRSPTHHHVGSATLTGNVAGKEIISSSRLAVLWNFMLFHLPSIAVTLILFAFHVSGFCWAKEPTPDQLSALLFPAKAHEVLIIMSLSDILLHRIMYGLLGKAGIALGFVTGPFHIADPLYFFSRGFWSTARAPQGSRQFHRITLFLLCLLVFVGVTVGPLSGTLMIPRQDWVKTPTSDAWFKDHVTQKFVDEDTLNPLLFYITRNPYPETLTRDYAQQAYGICPQMASDDADVAMEKCEVFDFKPFLQEVGALSEVSAGGTRAQFNISVTRDGTSTPYRPLSTNLLSMAGLATGPMDFVSYDLNRYSVSSDTSRDVLFQSLPRAIGSGLDRPKLKKWKQPLVVATCAPGTYDGADGGSLSFSWDDELLKHANKLTMREIKEAMSPLDDTVMDDAKSFSLHLGENRAPPLPLSATILLSDRTMPEAEDEGIASTRFELCYVIARWHEADVWTDTRLPTGAQSELSIDTGEAFEYMGNEDDDTVASVSLSDKWLDWIGPFPDEESAPRNTDYYELLKASDRIIGETPSVVLSRLMALYIADAMTMSTLFKYDDPQEVDIISSDEPDAIATEVSATAYSHLYTYNFEDTRSRPVAFTLLFFHMALAIGHHLIIAFSRKPWHATGWGSAEELISLALRSPSPEGEVSSMDDIVTSSAARKLPVFIWERDSDKKLEMVVAPSDGALDDVEASTGANAVAARGRMRRVESGLKYI